MSFIFENVLARKQLEIDASTGPSTKCRHNNIEIMPNHLLSCRRFERRRSFSKWRVAGVHANEPNPESRSKIQKNGITHEREIGICKLRLCFFHQRAPLPFFLLFLFLLLPRESVLVRLRLACLIDHLSCNLAKSVYRAGEICRN